MAICELKKIEIIGVQKIKNQVVQILQEEGMVQLISLTTPTSAQIPGSSQIERIEYMIKYLEGYLPRRSLREKLSTRKPIFSPKEIEQLLKDFDFLHTYKEIRKIERRIGKLQARQNCNSNLLPQLTPWLGLAPELTRVERTKSCNVVVGRIGIREFPSFREGLARQKGVEVKVVKEEKETRYLLIVYLKKNQQSILNSFKKYNFEPLVYPRFKTSPAQSAERITRLGRLLDARLKECHQRAERLTGLQIKLKMLYDRYWNLSLQEKAGEGFLTTEHTFFLSGWVPAKISQAVKTKLEKKFKQIAINLKDPEKGEKVPVLLENPAVAKPFEVVTGLYGQPGYGKIDPTPYLAPFFALFFGLCLGDAAYGIIMTVLCLVTLRKFKLTGGMEKFMKLFLWCGIATIFGGVITGGWFGDLPNRLPQELGFLKKARDSLVLFDPVENATTFILIAMGLGFLQIFLGVGVKLAHMLKIKDYKSAFLREIPSLLIQVSFVLLLLTGLMRFFTIPGIWMKAFLGIFASSCLVLLGYHWVSNKGVLMKILSCWFGLYGVITGNSLGDIISYVRLFALGLTTALLAMAVNQILGLLWGKWYFIWLVPIGFVGGHLINLALNALGAYVHTSRLQYYEFFTKFFEGGGKSFKPFQREYKYTFIK